MLKVRSATNIARGRARKGKGELNMLSIACPMVARTIQNHAHLRPLYHPKKMARGNVLRSTARESCHRPLTNQRWGGIIKAMRTTELIKELMSVPQINRFIKNSDQKILASLSTVCNLMLLRKGEKAISIIMANWVVLGMNQKIDQKTIKKNARDESTDFILHYKMFAASNQMLVYKVRKSIKRIYRKNMVSIDPVESLMNSAKLTSLYLLLLLSGKMYFMSRAQ